MSCWVSWLLNIAQIKDSKSVRESFVYDQRPFAGATTDASQVQSQARRRLELVEVTEQVGQIAAHNRSVRGLLQSRARMQSVSAWA